MSEQFGNHPMNNPDAASAAPSTPLATLRRALGKARSMRARSAPPLSDFCRGQLDGLDHALDLLDVVERDRGLGQVTPEALAELRRKLDAPQGEDVDGELLLVERKDADRLVALVEFLLGRHRPTARRAPSLDASPGLALGDVTERPLAPGRTL